VTHKTVSQETTAHVESTKLNQGNRLPSLSNVTEETETKNRWRGACEKDQQQILIKSVPHNEQSATSFSYEVRMCDWSLLVMPSFIKVRGEDNRFYTIEITRVKKAVEQISTARPRTSLSPIWSFTSMLSRSKDSPNKGKKKMISSTRSTRTTFHLRHEQSDADRVPFAAFSFTRQPLRSLNHK
jgi:hypothetical protein